MAKSILMEPILAEPVTAALRMFEATAGGGCAEPGLKRSRFVEGVFFPWHVPTAVGFCLPAFHYFGESVSLFS